MAYQHYGPVDPDALPAHATPDQAAQMMAGYDDKPAPLQPQQHAQQQHYKPTPPPPGQFAHPGQQYAHHAPPPQQQPGHGPPPRNPYASPPPPHGYANTPPPGAYNHGRSPVHTRPPPTPAPPQGADPTLFPLFKAVDKDGSGQLSERELRTALVNGDWTSFDPQTVRMMIRMFDRDRSGMIGFEEFCLFDRFDADRSGNISYDEFTNALAAFGYRLSPQFVQLLFRSYDRRGQDNPPQSAAQQGQNAISFDLFVQSCISLKRMTEVFKKYDDDRDGYITLSFEEFLTEILRQR